MNNKEIDKRIAIAHQRIEDLASILVREGSGGGSYGYKRTDASEEIRGLIAYVRYHAEGIAGT